MRLTPAQNFGTYVQRSNTAVTTTASGSNLLTANPSGFDIMVVNNGSVGAQIAFGGSSVVAVNTAAAGGTSQTYVPAGAVMVLSLGNNQYWSAITDSGTTSLIMHVGTGT